MQNMSKVATQVFRASEAKNNFGKLIDAAQRKPVAISRRGRIVAYVISPHEMEIAMKAGILRDA
jgi:prevent-host-death family protein